MRIDPDRPVDPELVERLLAIAATAPNHHRTFPWRFRVLAGEARARLGEALATTLLADPGVDAAKVSKARSKYLRAPIMIVAASATDPDPITTIENRDAVAASVQTLLLAATSAGLASLWSTGAAAVSPEVADVCELAPDDEIVGLIYLGWPSAELEPVERPAPDLRWLDPA